MGLNAKKVFAPTPDQNVTTGAISIAPVGTAMPTTAREVLPSATWDDSGYVSEDGISVTITRSTSPIRDWSKAAVRNLLSEFGGSIALSFLQVDSFAAKRMFGDDNVTVVPATATAGEQITIAIGAKLPPIEAWCFSMKDDDARIRVLVPCGQMTDVNAVDFKPDAGHVLGGTLACYDDGTGNSIYFIYDDGEVISDGNSYTITKGSVTHGSIAVSADAASQGTVVTVIATPSSGYETTSVTYTPSGGSAQNATAGNGVFTFAMPNANVTVSATFEEVSG